MDYRGYDIGARTTVANQEACAKLSFSIDGSLFWTFQPSTNFCWLKTSNSGRVAMENIVSGNKECGKTRKSKQIIN